MKNRIKILSSGLLLASLFFFGINSATAQDTVVYNFTGAPAQFTVPPGYTCDIEIIIAGASGGDNLAQTYAGYAGGEGAVITEIIPVSPGDVWDINIGGQGTQGNGSGGYNGGGTGFGASGNYASGGGGGATNVDINGTPTYIAGAGGGAGGGGNSSFYTMGGGDGGCLTGVTPPNSPYAGGGGGGTQVAAGAGGNPWAGVPPGGSPGVGSQGGMGGNWNTASGGGGGGGYFAGGGGGNDGCCTGANAGGGGGGGSSLFPVTATCSVGGNIGDGYVMIIMPPCATLMCAGDTAYVDFAGSFPAGTVNYTVTPAATSYQPIAGGSNIGFLPQDTTTYQITATTLTGPLTMPWDVNTIDPILPDAGIDDTICFAGGPAVLTGTEFNNGDSTYWEFSSAVTFTGALPTVSFAPDSSQLTVDAVVDMPGYYEFILWEEDTLGICPWGSDTVFVYYSQESHDTVLVNPSCFGYADGSITINSDATALSGNLGANEYSIDGGVTWQASNSFTGLTAGFYDVMSRDYLGCDTMTVVELVDPPQIVLSLTTSDTVICQNGTATMGASAAPAGIYTYDWTIDPSTAASITVTPSPAGTDMSTDVYAISDIGCYSDTLTLSLTHHDPITLTITANDSICPGDASQHQVTAIGGLNGYNYSWTANGSPFGGNADIIGMNPTANTQYCVTVSDVCETTPETICSDVIMRNVPVPSFFSDTTWGCNPTTVEFTNSSSYSDSINWIINGTTYYNIDPVSVIFDEVGLYDVWLQVYSQYGCEASTNFSDYITIHDVPDPFFYMTPNPTTIFNTSVDMNNISDGIGNTYLWSFPGGLPSSTSVESPNVYYPEGIAAQYPVSLTVTNQWGCIDSISSVLDIQSDVIIYAPNIFTPDGDEYNEYWRVHIDGIDIYDFHLTMFNRWGEPVWESFNQIAEWHGHYGDNGQIQDGTYVWLIEAKDSNTDKKYEFRGHVTVLK
jgi:gliding motility-associated-like protein